MNQIISNNIDLNLRIKTRSEHGVILWTACVGTMDQDSDDYLSLGIEDGYLHFRYNLGSGEVDIRFNATKISDGLWHRVRAIRNNQEGYLEVDGRKSITLRSPGTLRQLNTDTGLYVGGLPDSVYFPRRRYTNGIVGCISEIVISGEFKMNFDPNTLGTAHNVETGIL
ncbi:pikachurin-like [Musca vetustissima]|nr:pikachurin-like [Musca vetustissima]